MYSIQLLGFIWVSNFDDLLGFVYVCSAISVIWIEFVREVRWCWEESQPLPLMPAIGSIDLSTCVINQKLHMVSIHSA